MEIYFIQICLCLCSHIRCVYAFPCGCSLRTHGLRVPWGYILCCMDLLGVLYLYCLYVHGNPMGRGCFCLLPCFSRRLCVRVFVCM